MPKISFNSHTQNESSTRTEDKHRMRRAINALAESCYEHQLNQLKQTIQEQSNRISRLQADKDKLEYLCKYHVEQNMKLKAQIAERQRQKSTSLEFCKGPLSQRESRGDKPDKLIDSLKLRRVQMEKNQATKTLEQYPYPLLPQMNVEKLSQQTVGFSHQQKPFGRRECTKAYYDTLFLDQESEVFVEGDWGDSELHQSQWKSHEDTLIEEF